MSYDLFKLTERTLSSVVVDVLSAFIRDMRGDSSKPIDQYGDDAIARVLNKLGHRTATGKRWNEFRVKTIRGKYSIPGHIRTMIDPEILTLGQAAKYLKVSRTTIKRLVASGDLEKKQVVPWAPWEIKKSYLYSDRIMNIIEILHETGKLKIKGVDSMEHLPLFTHI